MNCPACQQLLTKKKLENFEIASCDSCRGLWIDSFTFKELKAFESPFTVLKDIDIWDDVQKHKVAPSDKTCPGCKRSLYKTEYSGSGISMDICPYCRSLWFDRGELEKIIGFIEKEIDEEKITEVFDQLGEELKEFLFGEKSIDQEARHIGLLVKLLEYKVFSRFRFLQDLVNALPI